MVSGIPHDVRDVRRHAEAVREARRHEELVVVLVGQLAHPGPAERRRRLSQVHGDVVHGAARAAHELRLSGRELEVQRPDRVPDGARVVVLHEPDADPRRRQMLLPERLQEEPPLVGVDHRLEQDEPVETRLPDRHGRST